MADPNDKSLSTVPSNDDDSMKIAVLGHLLKLEREQTASTIEAMATLLEAAVPDRVEVTRGGWPWSKVKPVERLTIALDDINYEITKSKHGAPAVTQRKVVGGIVIKTTKVTMVACITDIVERLTALENESAATRIALKKFATGR